MNYKKLLIKEASWGWGWAIVGVLCSLASIKLLGFEAHCGVFLLIAMTWCMKRAADHTQEYSYIKATRELAKELNSELEELARLDREFEEMVRKDSEPQSET